MQPVKLLSPASSCFIGHLATMDTRFPGESDPSRNVSENRCAGSTRIPGESDPSRCSCHRSVMDRAFMSLFNAPIATCSSPSSLLPGIGTGGQKQREHRSPQTSTRRAAAARPAARRLARQPPLQRHAATPAHHPPCRMRGDGACVCVDAPAATNTSRRWNWNFGWQRSPLHQLEFRMAAFPSARSGFSTREKFSHGTCTAWIDKARSCRGWVGG